jgi:hypothetical protein
MAARQLVSAVLWEAGDSWFLGGQEMMVGPWLALDVIGRVEQARSQ